MGQFARSLITVPAVAALALAACQKHDAAPAATPSGASRGEMPMGGAHGPSWSDPDAKLFFQLALLEGHLNIGRELIDTGHKDQSLPHFGHPVRELYGDIRPLLQRRGVPQFYRDLVKLEALAASAPEGAEFKATFQKVMAEVDAARASIPQATQGTKAFRLGIAADVLRTAAQEYRNAVVAGKVENAVEYHDARGFVFYAQALMGAGAEPQPAAKAVLDKAAVAVAPLEPPLTPIMTPEAFDALAAQLEAIRDGKA